MPIEVPHKFDRGATQVPIEVSDRGATQVLKVLQRYLECVSPKGAPKGATQVLQVLQRYLECVFRIEVSYVELWSFMRMMG